MILQPLSGGGTKQTTASSSGKVLPPLSSTITTKPKATKPSPKPIQKPNPEPEKNSIVKTAKDIFTTINSFSKNLAEAKKISQEEGARRVGKFLQKTPDVNLGTKGKKTFKATDTEEKIMNFMTNLPSAVVRSFGQDIEWIYTPEGKKQVKEGAKDLPKTIDQVGKHIERREWMEALSVAASNPAIILSLDVAGFLPVGAIGAKVLKTAGIKTVSKEALVKEVEKELTEVSAKELGFKQPKVKTEAKVTKPEVKSEAKKKPSKKVVEKPQVANAGLYDTGKVGMGGTKEHIAQTIANEEQQASNFVSKVAPQLKDTGVKMTDNSIGVLKGNVRGHWIDNEDVYTFYPTKVIPEDMRVELQRVLPSDIKVSNGGIDIPKSRVAQPTKGDIVKPIEPKTSGVARQIEAKGVEKGMIDKGYNELAQYDSSTIKAQSQAATKYSVEDINKIATGEKPLPKELKPGTPLSIAEDYAIKNNDTELLRKLANSPLTTQISESASELSLSRMRDTNSPVKLIRDIKKLREEAASKKLNGKTTKEATKETTDQIKAKVKKPDKYDWNNFVKSLEC